MRNNHRLLRSLPILLVTFILCMSLILQYGIRSVQADEGNIADKAVAFIKTQYQSYGAQDALGTHYSYVAYELNSAAVDTSGWVHNELSFTNAVYRLVDADVNNTTSVKQLVQDLITMQAWGDNSRANQLRSLLTSRQNNDGSFKNESIDYGAYSIIPAYELLGRASQLSAVNTDYAMAYILSQQNPVTGAWPDGDYPDFMTTAQAIRALNYLSPGAAADSAVGMAIINGCNWLQQKQQTEGSFTIPPYDDPLIDTTEAIATQQALGLNPAAAWINNGKSAVDYLNNSAVNADGSLGSGQNLMDAAWVLNCCKLLGILPGSNTAGDGTTVTTHSSCSPKIAVVGMNGEILYGPSRITVSDNDTWGLTVLGALDATRLSYDISTSTSGFVVSIDGQDNSGNQGWMYTVNGAAPIDLAGNHTISSSDQVIWYYSKSMDQPAPTWSQLLSDTYSTSLTPAVATSTSGSADVNPAVGGKVGLGSEAAVEIPADALVGTKAVSVEVKRLSSPPSAPDGFSLLGSVFEFSVGGSIAYTFNQPVTLHFTFNSKDLVSGQTPSINYYDEKSLQWVDLGGTISGNTISVDVDHFTKYALFARKAATPVIEKTFTDVPADFWAGDAIKDLCSRGYINGYPDDSFKPDRQISRAEFIAILNKALNLPSFKPDQADFEDVASADWFYESVENAVHAGIVKGYGKIFLPDRGISREEMAAILVKALGSNDQAQTNMQVQSSFTDDVSISDWARGYVIFATQQGLMKGYLDGSIHPQGQANRAEACSMIIKFLNLKNSQP